MKTIAFLIILVSLPNSLCLTLTKIIGLNATNFRGQHLVKSKTMMSNSLKLDAADGPWEEPDVPEEELDGPVDPGQHEHWHPVLSKKRVKCSADMIKGDPTAWFKKEVDPEGLMLHKVALEAYRDESLK